MFNTKKLLIPVLFSGVMISSTATAGAMEEMLQQYQQQGAGEFSTERGKTLWEKQVPGKNGKIRQCATCHTDNLHQAGKHARTGKHIKPLAPATNPKRLIKTKKIKKWFRRNCKWTWGRLCTPQEKGDLLVFISQQ